MTRRIKYVIPIIIIFAIFPFFRIFSDDLNVGRDNLIDIDAQTQIDSSNAMSLANVNYIVKEVSNYQQFLNAIDTNGNFHIKLMNDIYIDKSINNHNKKINVIIDGNNQYTLYGPLGSTGLGGNNDGLIHHKYGLLDIKSAEQHYIFKDLAIVSYTSGGLFNVSLAHENSTISFDGVDYIGPIVIKAEGTKVTVADSSFELLSTIEISNKYPHYQSKRTDSPDHFFIVKDLVVERNNVLRSDQSTEYTVILVELISLKSNSLLDLEVNKPIVTKEVQGVDETSKIIYRVNGASEIFIPEKVILLPDKNFNINNVSLEVLPNKNYTSLPKLTLGKEAITISGLNYKTGLFKSFEEDSIWGKPSINVSNTRVTGLDVSVKNSDIDLNIENIKKSIFTERTLNFLNSNLKVKVNNVSERLMIATESKFEHSDVNIDINNVFTGTNNDRGLIELRHPNAQTIGLLGVKNYLNFQIINTIGNRFDISSVSDINLFSYNPSHLPVVILPVGGPSYFVVLNDQQIYNKYEGDSNILLSQTEIEDPLDWRISVDNSREDYSVNHANLIRFDARNEIYGDKGFLGSFLENLTCGILETSLCPKESARSLDSYLLTNFSDLSIGDIILDPISIVDKDLLGITNPISRIDLVHENEYNKVDFNWDASPISTLSLDNGLFNMSLEDMEYGNLIMRIKDNNLIRYERINYLEPESIGILVHPKDLQFGTHIIDVNSRLVVESLDSNLVVRDTRTNDSNWKVVVSLSSNGISNGSHNLNSALQIGDNCTISYEQSCELDKSYFIKDGSNYTLKNKITLAVDSGVLRYIGDYVFDLNWKLIE